LRRQLEDRLRQTTEEYQEFILTAAHDLREPLRAVSAYSELLARKDSQRAEEEADQFRRHILDGTARIQTLLAGMVEYATAESDGRYLLRIDMNEVFREAVTYPRADSRHRLAVVTRDPLPFVKGDFERLVKVLRHLLDNASRYCESAQPTTHVASRRDGAEWLFMVKDNGPGIDAAYHKRIFAPFKRLHGRHHAGTGLGLTFCQRVIESHGGRIWVESGAGEGATFFFTLPAAD
jgi:light-regulated signal transduction histidine kinase (bacteriophytochrome)